MPFTAPAPLLGASTVTSSGVGPALNLGQSARALDQVLTASGWSGSGKVQVGFDTSYDSLNWVPVGVTNGLMTTLNPITGNEVIEVKLRGIQQWMRARWTVTGTPTVTIQMGGVSLVVYASPADVLALGLPPNSYGVVDLLTQARILDASTDTADSFIRMQYSLPLLKWDSALTRHVVKLYTADVLERRGVNPEPGAYNPAQAAYKEARDWLRLLGAGDVDAGIEDSSPTQAEGGAIIITQPRRGWNNITS